jgi:hypothetical protein
LNKNSNLIIIIIKNKKTKTKVVSHAEAHAGHVAGWCRWCHSEWSH